MNDDRASKTCPETIVRKPEDTIGRPEENREPKVQNPRELDGARLAALDCRASSDQARGLVVALAEMVVEHELASGTRTNKRKKKQTTLGSAVERLLADLLLAQTKEKSKGYVYRS